MALGVISGTAKKDINSKKRVNEIITKLESSGSTTTY